MNTKIVWFVFVLLACSSEPAETNRFPPELAGTYVEDSGFYVSYVFGTNGAYTNVLWACSRGNSRDTGTAVLSNNFIIFRPDDPRDSEEPLIPAKWGDRRYLIRADEIVEFCGAVNLGSEPRDGLHGEFLLRNEDWKLPVKGRPELPAEYYKYLFAKPLAGKVTEVIDDKSAWIDLGSEHGLAPRMNVVGKAFYVVERVYARQSMVKVEFGQAPTRGEKVSTAYADKKETR